MLPFIPAYQTLGLFSGWKLQSRASLPYPLSHDQLRLYYLGRNAVFHGAIALDLKAGDEVLFPAYHSGTEAAPLRHLGLKLNFYSVARDYSLDLEEIESKITPATKALYAIHFFGFPGPIAALRELADRYAIPLIEDVALSFLADIDGRPLGTWGDISIFTLYKAMPVAAGGVLAINRPGIALPPAAKCGGYYSEFNLTAKHVLNHLELHFGRCGQFCNRVARKLLGAAIAPKRPKLESPETLTFEPYLLNRGMGALTRGLLRHFDYASAAARRRENYESLVRRLLGSQVVMMHEHLPEGAMPLFFPILVEDKFAAVARLHAAGVEAIPVWGIHHPWLTPGEFPDVEFMVNHAVEIPIYQDLRPRHLDQIARALEANCSTCNDAWLQPLPQRESLLV